MYRSSWTTTSSRDLCIQSTKLVQIKRCLLAIDQYCLMDYMLQNHGMTTSMTSVIIADGCAFVTYVHKLDHDWTKKISAESS